MKWVITNAVLVGETYFFEDTRKAMAMRSDLQKRYPLLTVYAGTVSESGKVDWVKPELPKGK